MKKEKTSSSQFLDNSRHDLSLSEIYLDINDNNIDEVLNWMHSYYTTKFFGLRNLLSDEKHYLIFNPDRCILSASNIDRIEVTIEQLVKRFPIKECKYKKALIEKQKELEQTWETMATTESISIKELEIENKDLRDKLLAMINNTLTTNHIVYTSIRKNFKYSITLIISVILNILLLFLIYHE